MPTETTHRQSFQNYDKEKRIKAERFDKLIDRVRMSVKGQVLNQSLDATNRARSSHRLFRKSAATKDVNTKVDPKKLKLAFFKGKGNITSLFQKNEDAKATTYQNFFSGLPVRDVPRNAKEFYSVSRGTGMMMPDPNTMRMTMSKLNCFKTQLQSFDNKSNHAKRLSDIRSTRLSQNFQGAADFSVDMGRRTLQNLHKF